MVGAVIIDKGVVGAAGPSPDLEGGFDLSSPKYASLFVFLSPSISFCQPLWSLVMG